MKFATQISPLINIYCLLQEDIHPIPIKFELTPIVNLLTVDNLDERYNITSKAILEWFLPLYLKYCKVCITTGEKYMKKGSTSLKVLLLVKLMAYFDK